MAAPQKKITITEEFEYQFSICSLVTRPDEYGEMVQSFLDAGFDESTCEYVYIDNSSSNFFNAYTGINRLIRSAKGKYLVICHQDILLHDDDRKVLESRIAYLDERDRRWAILSNAGGINLKYRAVHLTKSSGHQTVEKQLPLKTMTIDEHFMVLRSDANLALSADLDGFHFYGTDICLVAAILGFNAYIIDFNLTHKSDGTVDQSFVDGKNRLIAKYNRALRDRFLATTITRFFLSGSTFKMHLFNTRFLLWLVRQYYKIFRTRRTYHLKD